jgi:hypothetical protein
MPKKKSKPAFHEKRRLGTIGTILCINILKATVLPAGQTHEKISWIPYPLKH